jgi:hypothetical protein
LATATVIVKAGFIFPVERSPAMNQHEKRINNLLHGRTWLVDVDTDDEPIIVRDQGNFIMTRAEWEEVRTRIEAFYDTVPAEAIYQHNDAIERRLGFGKYRNVPRERTIPPEPKPKLPKPGYIYLLHGEDTPWYKIGISIKPAERKYSLGTNSPFPIITISYYDVEDMHSVEAWWHETFAHKRKHGEWFELDEYDILLFDAQEGRPIL